MSGDPAASKRWLSIVGIGEDGAAGLSPLASRRIEAAAVVFGGARHLALAQSLISGEAIAWPSPFALDGLLARRGETVVVLASGDPFLHGVGNMIVRHVPIEEIEVLPAPSAFSLAAARLGWPLADITTLSLHGKPIEWIRPHLHDGGQILALTSDAAAPAAIAGLLAESGFGRSRLTVLEALGGPQERVRQAIAAEFALRDIHPLNVLAIEVQAEPGAHRFPRSPGLPDDWFEHDGQITKSEIRALTIAALAPRLGELLWDIGAGSGSVSIEWLLSDRRMKAVAIEARADRADRILRNAHAFGVPGLTIRHGTAPAALAGLPLPNAIFVGGGASPAVLDAAIAALPSGGRLVVNSVTLDTEAVLIGRSEKLGGSLTRIAIDRARPLGSMTAWEPARPVVQWSWVKP